MKHDYARKAAFVCISLFLTVLPGCCPISSLHPLSDPKNAWYDDRLTGAWSSTIDGDTIFLHIGKGRDNFTLLHPLRQNWDGTLEVNETYPAFPTNLGGQNLLNIRMPSIIEGKEEGYLFFLYELDGSGRLSIYSWDEKTVLESVLNRELKGETAEKPEVPGDNPGPGQERKAKCLRITDEPGHIIQYINKIGIKKLFSKPVGTFEKMERESSRKAPPGSGVPGKNTL